jgi:hypothetical protein
MKKFILLFLVLTASLYYSNTQSSSYSGSTVAYSWETANNLSYMCKNKNVAVTSGQKNSNLICAQTEFPKTSGGSSWEFPELKCPSGKIKCFVYATFGAAGGRCDGDPFRDDPSNMWSYLPEAVASKVIGQTNFKFELNGVNINGVSSPPQVTNTHESNRLKVLAYCDGTPAITTNSYYNSLSLGLFLIILAILF